MQPPRKPKWFRFSLRTLLLFVLTCGGGMTVWSNAKFPWVRAYRIQKAGTPMLSGFTPDDKSVYAVFANTAGDYYVCFYDADSGAPKFIIPCGPSFCAPEFSPGGTLFFLKHTVTKMPIGTHVTETGAEFRWKHFDFFQAMDQIKISAHDRFAAVRESGHATTLLLSLPDCEIVDSWRSRGEPVFSADESLVANVDTVAREIQINSTHGAPAIKWKCDRLRNGFLYTYRFSPDGAQLAITMDEGITEFYEAASGKRLYSIDGQISTSAKSPFSPDGRLFFTYGPPAQTWPLDSSTSWRSNSRKSLWSKKIFWNSDFSADSARLITINVSATDASSLCDKLISIHDARTGEPIAEKTVIAISKHEDFAHDSHALYDANTFAPVFDLKSNQIGGEIVALSSANGAFVVKDGAELQLWRRRDARVFYRMPAVWLTGILILLFSLSIWNDRKIGATKA